MYSAPEIPVTGSLISCQEVKNSYSIHLNGNSIDPKAAETNCAFKCLDTLSTQHLLDNSLSQKNKLKTYSSGDEITEHPEESINSMSNLATLDSYYASLPWKPAGPILSSLFSLCECLSDDSDTTQIAFLPRMFSVFPSRNPFLSNQTRTFASQFDFTACEIDSSGDDLDSFKGTFQNTKFEHILQNYELNLQQEYFKCDLNPFDLNFCESKIKKRFSYLCSLSISSENSNVYSLLFRIPCLSSNSLPLIKKNNFMKCRSSVNTIFLPGTGLNCYKLEVEKTIIYLFRSFIRVERLLNDTFNSGNLQNLGLDDINEEMMVVASGQSTLNTKMRRRKPELIIRENQPIELPPDVIRASDKPDLGLEELSSLNVKSKFQVFEKGESNNDIDRSPSKVDVKRSPSILSKLAKFQKKGMDVGVTDEDLDGFVYEESTSEEDDDEDEGTNDAGVVKCRKIREKPVSFGKMDDVKKNFESGATKKEERLEEKKKEIQNLRSRLFMGKQVKMKEMYEQAVAESEGKISRKESDVVRSEKAKAFREKFEKGEVTHSDDEEDMKNKMNEDLSIFEEGISKKSRSIFLEMDAKTQAAPPTVVPNPSPREPSKHVRDTDSPEREIYRDPDVVRSDDKIEDDQAVKRSQTASKMLSIFRQMEEQKEVVPEGFKPKKEFTPPPDFRGNNREDSEEESEEEDDEESEEESEEETEVDGVVKSSYKIKDEFLEVNKSSAAKARQLAAKFESWEPEKQSGNSAITMLDSEQPSLESTKSLREHFESLKNHKNQQENKSRPKVNRFVDTPPTICSSCDHKVYPLEKIETDGRIFHKGCFRCSHCNCILRMDSYTLNNGHLYCMPHFKQLFISKGNYDEGFGVDQHKRKWDISTINGSI